MTMSKYRKLLLEQLQVRNLKGLSKSNNIQAMQGQQNMSNKQTRLNIFQHYEKTFYLGVSATLMIIGIDFYFAYRDKHDKRKHSIKK